MCDYGNLEIPKFLEMQEKAKKFLYCNWHGFGYLLDCALQITSYLVTLLGIGAILATLELWVVLLFALLAALGAVTEALIRKKVKRLDDALIADQRQWSYYAGLFDKAEYGKEIRIYQAGQWLLSKERAFFTRANANLKKQNGEYTKSGLLISVFTFLQQLAGYVYLIHQVLAESISLGDFTMYVSAITVFASTFRQILSAVVEIRAYDMYFKDLDRYLSVPAVLRSGKALPAVDGARNITFKHVSFRYPGSERYALKDIKLTLRPGQKLLVVGENGAGKTTLFNCLNRDLKVDSGNFYIEDENGGRREVVANDIGYVLSTPTVPEFLTGREFLKFFMDINEKSLKNPKSIDEYFDDMSIDPEDRDKLLKDYSHGMKNKMQMLINIIAQPNILLLDEPLTSLDVVVAEEMKQLLRSLKQDRITIFSTHIMDLALDLCDEIVLLHHGELEVVEKTDLDRKEFKDRIIAALREEGNE